LNTTPQERWIDALVYRLYALTHAEVLAIDPAFPFPAYVYDAIDFTQDFSNPIN